MTRLVVRHHTPWRHRFIVAGLILVAGLITWGLYEYGRYSVNDDYFAARGEIEQLLQDKQGLKNNLERQQEQNAIIERSYQIETSSYKELNESISGLQGEISELKEELAFYRGIVSADESSRGLSVQDFKISRNGVERGYRYKLVLTQVLNNRLIARGTVSLGVEGLQDGELKVLDLAQLSPKKLSSMKFRFRYLQNMEGDIILPEGFIAARAIIRVKPTGKRHKKLNKAFTWTPEENKDYVGQS